MTWKSHIAIATAVTLPINPSMIAIASAGATAPDWFEYILSFFGIEVGHRGFTHYLYIPLIFILIGLAIPVESISDLIFWFGIGYFTHWFADACTISGVPISQFGNHRIHFFGGKIETGEMLEYIVSFSFLLLSVLIAKPSLDHLVNFNNDENVYNFNPYMIDYKDLEEKKIIDPKTLREHRFDLF